MCLCVCELASQLGITDMVGEMLIRHRLKWLGPLGRMGSERLPKQLLFGEFCKIRPQHGEKKSWRDCIVVDLKSTGITEWYNVSQDRDAWRRKCSEGIELRKRNTSVE